MFRSVLYGANVAFLLLALGVTTNRNPENGPLAQLQDWADSQVVLQVLTTPGLTSSHVESLVSRLEARDDVTRVEFQLDRPEWTGNPDLAQQWQALWNERSVALLEIWPNWAVLERTPQAAEQWRDKIHQSFSEIREVLLLSDALTPLIINGKDETTYSGQLTILRNLACLIALLGCLAAFSSLHAAQDEFLRRGEWWTRGVASLFSGLAVYWIARGLFTGGANSAGLKTELTVSGCFVLIAAVLLLLVFDKSCEVRNFNVEKKPVPVDGEDSEFDLK